MPRAVIFDFDGVIFETERLKFQEVQDALRSYHISLAQSDFSKFIGKKTTHFLREQFPDLDDKVIASVISARAQASINHLEKYPLVRGIRELLDTLESYGIRRIITTGSKRVFVADLLTHSHLLHYFEKIVAGDDFVSSKPNPECYQVTLNQAGLLPHEVVVIEDSIAGIQAARSAGCLVFGLQTYLAVSALKQADKLFKDHFGVQEEFKQQYSLLEQSPVN